jgi:hypothetical protein
MPWDGLCHDGMVTCLYSGVDKPNKDSLSLSLHPLLVRYETQKLACEMITLANPSRACSHLLHDFRAHIYIFFHSLFR